MGFSRVLTSASVVAAVLALFACNKPPEQPKAPPAFVQFEYAKNADGDCVKHPTDFYEDMARAQKLQELTFLVCQYDTRSHYHGTKAGRPGTTYNDAELQIALRCAIEAKDIMEVMQRAGVTKFNCEALQNSGQQKAPR